MTRYKPIIRKKENKSTINDPDDLFDYERFYEVIDFKCSNCGYEEEQDADIVLECFEMDGSIGYPVSYCPKCDKPTFIPKEICEDKK